MHALPPSDITTILWRLAVTMVFVLLNGFFVAAEFSLVKVRHGRIKALAATGARRPRVVQRMLEHLGFYLSSCQLGITVASLILGWLAEPAVAHLLLAGAAALGLSVGQSPLLHGVSLGLALAIVTILHMTLGEQAPKIWAIHRAESLALWTSYPLRLFSLIFSPLIWLINLVSNGLLRLGGLSADADHEGSYSAEELRGLLTASAEAGHISSRQRQFAENVLGFMKLQVRHILVPRVDAVRLLTRRTAEENIRIIRDSRHSRFPLCEDDLDRTVGMIHAKDVLAALADGRPVDLAKLARKPVFVPDTQSLGRMIVQLQRARSKSAIVLDDRGTAIGLVFLEDALEEIVGPIQDEFDDEEPRVNRPAPDVFEIRGDMPLPDATEILGIDEQGTDDTVGGHVVSLLGRLPEQGDELEIGGYRVRVTEVARHRIDRLRFERIVASPDEDED